MSFAKILQAAAVHACGTNVPESLRLVVLFPPHEGCGSRVVANNGQWARVWHLDDQVLPYLCLPASELRDLVAGAAHVEVGAGEYGMARVRVVTRAGALAEASMPQTRMTIRVPPLPEKWTPVGDWPLIQWAAHAAAKDGEFGVVCLHQDRVEAIDGDRLARVDTLAGVEAVLPAAMVRKFPADVVEVAVGVGHVALRAGIETRYALSRPLPPPHGPALLEYAPRYHVGGGEAIVDRSVLLDAARVAAKAVRQGCVALEVTPREVVLGPWEPGAPPRARLRARVSGSLTRLVLNGHWIAEAVAGMRTAKVRLCYRPGTSIFRVESGAQVVVLQEMQITPQETSSQKVRKR